MASVQVNEAVKPGAHELRHLDTRSEDRLRELGAAIMPLQRLRRTGRAPFMFNGATLATVCGVTPALPFWYEINLHRTVIGTFITDVRLFRKAADAADLFRVAEHDTLDAAVAHLEAYAPDRDAVLPSELVASGASPAALALAAARLELQVEQLRDHYRAMLGDLLYALPPAD